MTQLAFFLASLAFRPARSRAHPAPSSTTSRTGKLFAVAFAGAMADGLAKAARLCVEACRAGALVPKDRAVHLQSDREKRRDWPNTVRHASCSLTKHSRCGH